MPACFVGKIEGDSEIHVGRGLVAGGRDMKRARNDFEVVFARRRGRRPNRKGHHTRKRDGRHYQRAASNPQAPHSDERAFS